MDFDMFLPLIYFAVVAATVIVGLRVYFSHRNVVVKEKIKQEGTGGGTRVRGLDGLLQKGIEVVDEKLGSVTEDNLKYLDKQIADMELKGATKEQLAGLIKDRDMVKMALKYKPYYDKLGGKEAVAEVARFVRKTLL